jgi:hypothetical protein
MCKNDENDRIQHLGYQAKAKFQYKALGQLHGCFSAKTQIAAMAFSSIVQ